MTSETITRWALENPKDAMSVGAALILLEKEGENSTLTEDFSEEKKTVVEWAQNNKAAARLLFLRLMPQVLAALKEK